MDTFKSKSNQIHYFFFFLVLLATQSCRILPKPLPLYDIAEVADKEGWYNFVNGKYRGTITDGIPNGKGIYIYKNGIKYEGNFVKGEIQGNGTLTIPDYGVVKGTFNSGLISSGEIEYANGNFFSGNFRDGKKYTGVYLGDTYSYIGGFENDLFSGSGLLVNYQNGVVYKGDFIRGQKNGEAYEYSFKESKTHFKNYKIGMDVTDNFYRDMTTKEVNREFENEKFELNKKFEFLENKLNVEVQKQSELNDTINNIDNRFIADLVKMCACALEKDPRFIEVCKKYNDTNGVFSCYCNYDNPYRQFGLSYSNSNTIDNRTYEQKKKDDILYSEEKKKLGDEYEKKFVEENNKLKPYCLSAFQNIESAKQDKISELKLKYEVYQNNISNIQKDLRQQEIAKSILSTRQEEERSSKVQEKIKIIKKMHDEKASNDFKALQSSLANSPRGCSCGCIILRATRPDRGLMRGCPR